jgi:hypothetical protein
MEATYVRKRHEQKITLAAALVPGEVYQLNDGRAGVFNTADGLDAGERAAFQTDGQYTVVKTASQVWIKGDPIWWDRSAGAATCLEPIGAADRDFYLGTATADAASADTTGSVNLNVEPAWIIDSARDNGDTVVVKTVVGSTTVEVPDVKQRGGMLAMNFGTTAEAQKVDWISGRSFALASNWVVDILFELVTAADNAAVDIDVGVASGTHATDFEAIAEFAAFHLDGDDLNIDAHSDDGTTDIAPTDTTVDIVAGTPIRLKLDGRDPNNVKYYVEGVEVLAATANLGDIDAGAGPLFATIHAEKTADDSPLAFRARIRVRTAEQD